MTQTILWILGSAGVLGLIVIAKIGMYRQNDTFGGFLGGLSDSALGAWDRLREVF